MGLSASQGRLLMLTARRSDLEFRAQQIAHQRILLSQELESIAKDYERATTNKKLTIRVCEEGGKAEDKNLTYQLLIDTCNNKTDADGNKIKTRVKDNDGNVVVPSPSDIPGGAKEYPEGSGIYIANGNSYVVMPALKEKQTDGSDINAFQTMLTMGILHIEQQKTDSNGKVIEEFSAINYEDITDSEPYTDDDNAAEIKYKRAQQEIQTKDKKLELELNQIETQRNAVTTEIDSVKKVISDNIEKTFKYFS